MIAILIYALIYALIVFCIWASSSATKRHEHLLAFIYAAFSGALIMVLILRVVIMYAGVDTSGEVALQAWKGWAGVILSSGGIV